MTDKKEDFKILSDNGGYIVVNIRGDYENHTHLKTLSTCELLIKLVCKKVIPKSNYLKISAKRISRNLEYKANLEKKITY